MLKLDPITVYLPWAVDKVCFPSDYTISIQLCGVSDHISVGGIDDWRCSFCRWCSSPPTKPISIRLFPFYEFSDMSGHKTNHLKSSGLLPFHPERGLFPADWVGRWHQPHLIISDGGVTEMTIDLLKVSANSLPPRPWLTPPSPRLPLPEYHHRHELPTKARRRMFEASPDGSVLSSITV